MLSESIFLIVWRSFFSAEAYRTAARARTITCALVLALAVALVSLGTAIQMSFAMRKAGAEFAQVFAGMPVVHIDGGEARLDPPGRFVGEIDGKPFVVLDPEMSIDEAFTGEQGLYLTRTHVIIRSEQQANTRSYALDAIDGYVIREADLVRWTRTLFAWLPWLLFPFLIAFSLGWRMLIASAIAVVGIPLAGALKAKMDYAGCFRVLLLASVPALLVGGVASIAGRDDWWPAWLGIACTLGYFVFGLAANRTQPSVGP